MTLQEVQEIKAKKSQIVKDMTVEQLNEYYADNLNEFNRIIGNQVKSEKQKES